MKIDLPISIHNKFEIEVKDIITGDIVKKGYAENIVLDSLWSNSYFLGYDSRYVGSSIAFGRGTGTLNVSRTTLFSSISYKASTAIEVVVNQAPIESYSTKKIVIEASEHVDETITEVGVCDSNGKIGTHALIKDSEGNPLSIGPKTNTQEITIYATTYFKPNFEEGIALEGLGTSLINNKGGNALLAGALLYAPSGIKSAVDIRLQYDNSQLDADRYMRFEGRVGSTFLTPIRRMATSEGNGKIKTLGARTSSLGGGAPAQDVFTIYLETLAENNSTLWGGWEFDKTPIGVGDGSTTMFNLIWDEVWLDKPKVVYVDGVVNNSVTWASGSITFETAPSDQSIITADYWVKYIPKDINHVLDVQFAITFGEGSAS